MSNSQTQDLSQLHADIGLFYDHSARYDRPRVKVETAYYDANGTLLSTWVRCGTVGITTGWRPAYLIMPRVDSVGSSDLVSLDSATCKTRVIGTNDGHGHYSERYTAKLSAAVGFHDATTDEDN
ncbi:hypothetical protein SEA_CHEWYVIII_92 [Rhodococcus phage ChewyVIII]|uniref:Uncharacterized protein n=1 Tax=Rhodococcus phage ChewyVIII TaxID=1887657 RepID=A0A1C9EIB2_9CAUD|nr:hypothetical protein QEH30_gp92 [Rhodococcus phage ChewyVIII]AON97512.1 hypothetical protein SEA_CHEWYVIII_92 [Rhodococcus phage ChewyVIII]